MKYKKIIKTVWKDNKFVYDEDEYYPILMKLFGHAMYDIYSDQECKITFTIKTKKSS